MRRPVAGDSIRVERDETLHPSKGTWPQFRGRTGMVAVVNRDKGTRTRPADPTLNEYGVSFTKSRNVDAWFKVHELTLTGMPQSKQDRGGKASWPNRGLDEQRSKEC